MNIKNPISLLFSFVFIIKTVDAQTPIAQWSFNEGAGNIVKENYSNASFTINSNWPVVEWVKGVKQTAMRTDGYSVWAEGTMTTTLPTTSITISAWVAPEVYPVSNSAIWAQFDNANKLGVWMGMDKYGRLVTEFNKSGADLIYTSSQSLTHYKWNYIVVNIDAQAGSITAYINAVKTIDDTFGGGSINWPSGKTTLIGKYPATQTNGLYNTNTMNAIIDEVNLYSSPLNQSTITSLYQQDNPATDPDMKTPASRFANDFLRPRYHPIPNSNWCNESHGLIYYNGNYHLFYQKNGNGSYLFQQNWGHLISPDLVSWHEVVPALWPSPGWDNYGIWSGHCIFDTLGMPRIFYAGVNGVKAGIGAASPSSDDLLTWQKSSFNPVIPSSPSSIANKDFRDPYLFKEGGIYYMITGSGLQSPDVGTVFLYKSLDLNNWELLGPMYQGDNSVYDAGVFWEMPVFWKFGNKYMLLVNKTPETNNPARSFYWVGNFANQKFTPGNPLAKNLDLINWLLSPSVNTDKNGIVTAIGIIPDEIPSSEQYRRGYANLFSLPREWDMLNDQLIQKPHPSLVKLRSDSTFFNNVNVTTAGSNFLNGTSGFQKEIRAKITADPLTKKAGIIIEKNQDGSEYTKIYYDYYYGEIGIDRTHSSVNPNTEGDLKTVSFFPDDPSAPMDWHIYIDGSVVEVFINDKYALASRIYPLSPNSNGIDLFATGAPAVANVSVYDINSSSALPVSWLSFTGQKINDGIRLLWKVNEQINNDHYEIERSVDGIHFDSIGEVLNQNAGPITTYYYADSYPSSGKNFYRIKQVDKDGKFTYSGVLNFSFMPVIQTMQTKILQNPVKGPIQLMFLHSTGKADISLSNATSQNILHLTKNDVCKNQDLNIPANNLSAGIYFLKVTTDNNIETHRIIIQ